MKKYILFVLLASIITSLIAQAPNAFNYQAIIRNADGTVKANETISLQINIVDEQGAPAYMEVHNTQTNEFGLVNVVIGEGTTSDDISTVEWSAGPYFLDIMVNDENLGSSPLLSVPYALYSQNAEEFAEGDPVFEAWDKSTGISILENQISNLKSYITSETDPFFKSSVAAGISQADTAKWNAASVGDYIEIDPIFASSQAAKITAADISDIENLSGINTGDQDLSSFVTKTALGDTATQIRADIPDVSGFLTSENDPIFSAWDKDYNDLANKPITITTEQVEAIVANTGKDTSGIYHSNRDALNSVSGTNTGDQSLTIDDHNLTITNGNTITLPDEVDDADNDPSNEIQELSISNDTVFLSSDSFIKLPHPGPYFIPVITHTIRHLSSPSTVDITQGLPSDVRACICIVEFLPRWSTEYYGGGYLEVYYGNQTETEKLRIEVPREENATLGGYTQSGPMRMQLIIPVTGNVVHVNHQGIEKIEVNGYFL